MHLITEKIDNILKNKNLTRYKLSKMFDCSESALNQMARGDISFSDNIMEKIIPILEVSREEFESWIVADKYSKETLELAIKAKKESVKRNSKINCQPVKKILTTKLDEILQSKNLSRTALSKQIKHSQSSVNNAITGKEYLSKKLMKKISTALEIPENEIQSWVIADKYSLKVLELAVNIE